MNDLQLLHDDLHIAESSGDFIIDDADQQDDYLRLKANPGDWKQSPLVYSKLNDLLLDNLDDEQLNQAIEQELINNK